MSKIYLNNQYCQIKEEDDLEFLSRLSEHLRYFVIGSEFSKAFQGYYDGSGHFIKWDGYKNLLSNKLQFLTGLLERVKQFYIDNNKEFKVIDGRIIKSKSNSIDISKSLKKIGIIPRDYQLQVLDAIEKYDRGIIKAATGSGKTLIAALVAAKLNKKTIIYVVGKDLLYQFHNLFSELFDITIGIVGDGHCEISDHINIVSVWTAGEIFQLKKSEVLTDDDGVKEKSISKQKYQDVLKLMNEAKVAIVDECHLSTCETIQRIYRQSLQMEYIYGLSGSPWNDRGEDLLLEGLLGSRIIDIPASQLIEQGYLAKPYIKFVDVPKMDCTKNYKAAYNEYIVENTIRNNIVADYAEQLVEKGHKTLVLFSSIKHGEILYDLISKRLKCAILNGSYSQDERDKVKKQLNDGKIDCILASKIYDLGIDLPILSGLILAGGGKSTTRAIQRIGRVIRGNNETKKVSLVVDFVDNAPYLKNHSKLRHKVYTSEKGFEVQWPKNSK